MGREIECPLLGCPRYLRTLGLVLAADHCCRCKAARYVLRLFPAAGVQDARSAAKHV
jgi:hypothetical protein